ncbi:hypothetical protein L6452_12182 [Arctium lappa]|uniref:Uncharacterized protein n=1 Tax=Arctium lappa TaxID=4217 RepID=A0ACB9DQ93_ARCLA|nr:hypothetical protein L6452_12182 [Arctium lappa]
MKAPIQLRNDLGALRSSQNILTNQLTQVKTKQTYEPHIMSKTFSCFNNFLVLITSISSHHSQLMIYITPT